MAAPGTSMMSSSFFPATRSRAQFLASVVGLFAAVSVLVLSLLLAGCSLREAFRFRMTVEIKAGERIYAGSSVLEAYRVDGMLPGGPQGPRFRTGLIGIAPTIDLGDKGVVVACLDGMNFRFGVIGEPDQNATGYSVEEILQHLFATPDRPPEATEIWALNDSGSTTEFLPRLVLLEDGLATSEPMRVRSIDREMLKVLVGNEGTSIEVRIDPSNSWLSTRIEGAGGWLDLVRVANNIGTPYLSVLCVERSR
jgi:hypothetical protein